MTDPDDLDELLAPPATGATPGLRDAIRRRTERRLAFGRWARRGVKLAATLLMGAAVFAAGVGVGVWRTGDREKLIPVPQVEVVAVPTPVFVPVGFGSAEQVPTPDASPTAAKLELNAELQDDPTAAAKFYRQAGDRYLADEQDYANAARCYRLFLARAGDDALSPEPGDSWLLTSLKNAAFKEKVHATPVDG
jgi:hypothetical protein